jgi:hypothetical protein
MVFLMLAILTEVRGNISVALICISFIWPGTVSTVSCGFGHLDFFLCKSPLLYWFIDLGEVSFLELPVYSSYQALPDIYPENIFSHSAGGIFN